MPVRFYVDADILGMAKALVQVRSDVTYPGDPGSADRPPCSISPGTKDPIWIPQVAAEGWVIITRDRHLMHRPDELAAIRNNGAKVVRLETRHDLTKWLQLEIVVTQWRKIEDLVGLPGPWIYRASRTAPLVKEL